MSRKHVWILGLIGLASCLLPAAAARAGQINVWCIDDMAKIDPTTGKAHEENPVRLPRGLDGAYRKANTVWRATGGGVHLTGARNEVVAFQIILEVQSPVQGVTFTATDLAGPGGAAIPAKNVALFREWYINVVKSGLKETMGDGWYPDVLIPLELGTEKYGAPLDIPDVRNKVPGQKNQGIWVDVYIPADAKPGRYKGAIQLRGPERLSVPVEVQVLNVAIPDAYHYSMNLNSYGDRDTPQRLKIYQIMQRHRIYFSVDSNRIKPDLDKATGKIDWTTYDAANGPLLDGSAFTEKNSYGPGPMTNTPVAFFELPFAANVERKSRGKYRPEAWPEDFKKAHTPEYEKIFKDTLKAFEAHFKEKGWTRTTYIAFFNGIDEPTGYAEYQEMKYLGSLVAEVNSPLFRHKVDIGDFANCYRRIPEFKSMQDMIDFMDPTVTFWCGNGANEGSTALYNVDAMAPEVKKGRLAYYYGTNSPPAQGGSFVDSESLGARLWPLIAARYNLSGGEIWSYMVRGNQAWEGKPTDDRIYFGYAQFLYPEKGLGVDFGQPITSIRLKGFRRGQQDAEYFWLARQGPHKAIADQLLDKLIPQALDKTIKLGDDHPGAWLHNPAEYEKARLELGKLLSAK